MRAKKHIFQEFNNVSLRNIMNYCYANTYYSCCGTDLCYHCMVNYFVKEEFHILRKTLPVKCKILFHGSRTCEFASCTHCQTELKINYMLTLFAFAGS